MASAPSLRDLVESTGTKIDDWFYNQENPAYAANQKLLADASSALYGNVGANMDTRNWDQILSSDNTIQAANDALASMYSDPVYREQNTANLTKQGYDPAQAYYTYNQMNDRVGANYVPTLNEVNAVNTYFEKLGLPGEKWNFDGSKITTNKATTTPTTTINTNNNTTPQQMGVTPQVMGPLPTGTSSNGAYNTWRAGAASNAMLGAGNANYHSELLKSLRQNSINPISNNQGVQFMQNRGASNSNWTPPTSTSGNMAFNPQVINPRAASAQEVADWNAYSTYRTNALNSKTPIVSFSEWLAGGKSTGKPADPTDPNQSGTNYPWDAGNGGGGGGDSP